MLSLSNDIRSNRQQGFNLIDLSVSILISAIAIALGGTGMISVLSFSRASVLDIDRQQDADQALDFIAAEARQAQKFDQTASSDFWTDVSTMPSPKTPVAIMQLKAPDQEVVYFIADATTPWTGNALYRWGPKLDSEGNYDDTIPPEQSLLIDQLSDQIISPDCKGLRPVPSTRHQGFYSCIETNGQIAEFILHSDQIGMEMRAKAFARSN